MWERGSCGKDTHAHRVGQVRGLSERSGPGRRRNRGAEADRGVSVVYTVLWSAQGYTNGGEAWRFDSGNQVCGLLMAKAGVWRALYLTGFEKLVAQFFRPLAHRSFRPHDHPPVPDRDPTPTATRASVLPSAPHAPRHPASQAHEHCDFILSNLNPNPASLYTLTGVADRVT